MKRFLAVFSVFVLLMTACAAWGEEAQAVKYETLRVGTSMQFSGNFFSGTLSNNISDMDVRRLIHGYSPAAWSDGAGAYLFDDSVVAGRRVTVDGSGNRTYSIILSDDLFYNDGTPVTAWDYAFSVLLETSRALETAAGARADGSSIVGFADYDNGRADALAGFRVYDDLRFAVTFSADYTPYFYELQLLDIVPYPIGVIAPGLRVADDGNGIRLEGNGFDAALLRSTLLDQDTGYAARPLLSCGPYMLTDYNGMTVSMRRNPYYKGNLSGRTPSVEKIEFSAVDEDAILQELAAGELDLVVRCTRQDNIMGGMQMIGSGEYGMVNYSRSGLSFMMFKCADGPAASVNVRKAVSMCLDKDQLIRQYVGGFGLAVDGYYGIGQWMYLMANGTMRPAESADGEPEDWSGVNMNGLVRYELDVEGAKKLLDEDGWTPGDDGVRYKEADGRKIPLDLKLYYPAENRIGTMMDQCFISHLTEAGVKLTAKAVSVKELLAYYYGEKTGNYDMMLLGTNFTDVFDPSVDFDIGGKDRRTGLTDTRLAQLAIDLRQTEPGDALTYVKKWTEFQQYRSSLACEIPLYSNAYFDFFTAALQDYNPAAAGQWTSAVMNARFGDFEVAETPF